MGAFFAADLALNFHVGFIATSHASMRKLLVMEPRLIARYYIREVGTAVPAVCCCVWLLLPAQAAAWRSGREGTCVPLCGQPFLPGELPMEREGSGAEASLAASACGPNSCHPEATRVWARTHPPGTPLAPHQTQGSFAFDLASTVAWLLQILFLVLYVTIPSLDLNAALIVMETIRRGGPG